MTLNVNIVSDIQSFSPGQYVELWEVDCTDLGGSIYRFTPNTTVTGTSVYLNGVEYLPLEIEIDGFEVQGTGQLPRPTVRISNINQTFTASIVSLNDMVGAKVTRRKTFSKYLDDGEEANSYAQFSPDVFYIDRKTSHNPLYVEWELISAVELSISRFPRRQVIRDICTHRYREWATISGTFDYSKATCPYTGALAYDENGEVTTSGNDNCGKRLYDCKLRYPNDDDELPFYGFPGVARYRHPFR